MRRKITVPADGESLNVAMTGASIVVESIPLYETPDDVPLLGFNSGDNQFPLYPRSTYTWPACFNNIVIVGTAESAGDEIILISFDDCLRSEVNINYSDSYKAYTKASIVIDLDDTVDQFTDLQLMDSDGNLPNKVFISTRSQDFIFAFDADPVQDTGSDLGTPWSEEQGLLEIEGINFIQALRFRARVSTETPSITVHFEY